MQQEPECHEFGYYIFNVLPKVETVPTDINQVDISEKEPAY